MMRRAADTVNRIPKVPCCVHKDNQKGTRRKQGPRGSERGEAFLSGSNGGGLVGMTHYRCGEIRKEWRRVGNLRFPQSGRPPDCYMARFRLTRDLHPWLRLQVVIVLWAIRRELTRRDGAYI
jgi:hypothetical protein